jgi:hypothetical protein
MAVGQLQQNGPGRSSAILGVGIVLPAGESGWVGKIAKGANYNKYNCNADVSRQGCNVNGWYYSAVFYWLQNTVTHKSTKYIIDCTLRKSDSKKLGWGLELWMGGNCLIITVGK